ncbi:4-(cytidine 5'-diphospho)-2-C-methyl-D-erythritol kinase [Sphingobacterium oryzagri]|uniref:4-diphosphocytidyl-2-C-methyl-D-erythritol kinase n=1 Tax=Sphingobacterium oryzagri TaxID=3025669 RepID=A0ABY7WFJ8_9SPHI|nr:4-(cytidine 5'-diphospho)-2-C-methyl-D-erythritol kinase [Sphingobacterium sp. KACC 22765]WDF67389.1 4-(cytidine 5'-diphospho)-2-C-methyl-D-erythritol kinase [Sphingobacterium sp. KACC 22765]
MISYANAKINIGLNITAKRPDGYHELETIFYPFPLYDIIELTENTSTTSSLEITGMDLPVADDNLCLKAYRLLAARFSLPAVHIHLHKQIPFGAGLGGGSADAAFVLKMLNEQFSLGLTSEDLILEAAKLGADCPFFVDNVPAYASGTGTDLTPCTLDLSDKYLVLVKPALHIGTAEAYRQVAPRASAHDLRDLIRLPVQEWKFSIKNDFEDGLFEQYPLIRSIKLALYEQGALYASMSGSGSSVYGIFSEEIKLTDFDQFGSVYYPVNIG